MRIPISLFDWAGAVLESSRPPEMQPRHSRWIRLRIPGSSKIEYSTLIFTLFLGKWGPILRSTLEKPKENLGFWLQPLKNLRKSNVFDGKPCISLGKPMFSIEKLAFL